MTGGQPAARSDRRLGRLDLYIAIAVFVVAWVGCRAYLPAFRAGGGHAMSYYDEFGPAVMAACGRGFVNPELRSSPALDAFLLERDTSFECRQLEERTAVVPFDNFQVVTRNLLLAAAAVWRIAGISWAALDNLAATMFAVTLTTAFVVMRFILPWPLAILGTFVWGISPMHLGYVPHLRDYSKAPFFVLAVLAIAIAIQARRPVMLVALGVAFGFVQAIGFGMRTDAMLNFAPFFLALVVLGSGGLKQNLPWKIAAACLSLVVFAAMAWPVLTVYRRSEALWHVTLLGLTTPFDSALNLRRAPYDFGYLYDDSYVSTVVTSYWYRVHDSVQVSLHNAMLYDRACKEYYALLVSTFPADFLTRMAGSVLHVLNLPFSIGDGIVPLGFTHPIMTWLANVRASVMLALAGAGPMLAALVLVLIGIRDRAAACVGFFILMFWASYPYLQFQGRHVFHLEILIIAILLWAAALTWRTVADVAAARDWSRDGRRALQSVALVAGLAGTAVFCVVIARIVQQPGTRALFERYAKATEERIDVQIVTGSDGVVRLTPTVFEPARPQARIQHAMLVLEVTGACGQEMPVHVRYQATGMSDLDFGRDSTVSTQAGSSHVFLPVYSIETADGRLSRFVSVDVPASHASCVRLSRAREIERLPLMLDATLPQNWRSQPLYHRLYLGPIMPERVWLRLARWWPGISELG